MADLNLENDSSLNSILTSIKKILGIEEEYEHFDKDLIIHINSIFMTLNQLSIGPENGFKIKDKTETWDSFLEDRTDLEAIKTYMAQKIRLIFDPPQMGYLVESINKQCQESEWRLNIQAEGKE